MIKYYKMVNGSIREVKRPESGRIWIDAYSPNQAELEQLSKTTKIAIDDLKMALDEDERPRIEVSKNYTMIIFRSPFEKDENEIETSSIGIFLTNRCVVTIHLYYTGYIMPIFEPSKSVNIKSSAEFLVYILSEITKAYSKVLRKIEKQVDIIEDEVIKDPQNVTIEKISDIKKTLIYFHRSLMANRVVVLNVIDKNIKYVDKKYADSFRDLHTEIFQLLEMTITYKDLLKGSTDSYASIVSNRLGSTVKILTVITAILTIPLLISGVYGMNIPLPFESNSMAFVMLVFLMIISMIGTWLFFKNKKWV